MKKVVIALAALWLCAACAITNRQRAQQLAQVAKDWCLTIRASQVLPVYPLTEDVQVGDVFLVSTPIGDEIRELESAGFLPLDNLIGRMQASGFAQFYNGAYQIANDSVLPRQWQFPNPPRTTPPLTDWGTAPGAAFPSYTFQVRQGAGASLALPVQSVPVGLSLLRTGSAYGTINITSASTYGLPIAAMEAQVDEWATANREFLRQYAPQTTTDERGRSTVRRNYVRIVNRVYVAGGVNVSLVADQSRGGRADAGASRPVALFDAGATDNAANAAKNYESVLSSLNESVASSTPGVNLTVASASSHSVAMNETFPRPLVIGFLAFDRAIEAGGVLGPPLPTQARVTGETVTATKTTYDADANSDTIRAWLAADPLNRQKLTDWLAGRGLSGSMIPAILNGETYRALRAQIVAEVMR